MTEAPKNKAELVKERLRLAFDPYELDLTDESAAHAGHAGAPVGGESHFNLHIRASAFAGKSRIERHRAVHAAIGSDLLSQIHALSIDATA